MADIFDRAQAREEQDREDALAAQRIAAARTPKLTPQGYCLNPMCCEPFSPSKPARLFCGPKCAEEHARYSRQ